MSEQFKSLAEQFIEEVRPISRMDFGYSKESVEWLEGYIERIRTSGQFSDAAAKSNLAVVFGAFLGECIIYIYGGVWVQRPEGWCVEFTRGTCTFPFSKGFKQLENGSMDGVGSFFRLIPRCF